jgi:2-hydroxy-6-oxonona-2,4-dienedioate hydrolase/4,5:9,10-diseco-3-hydroxy-5,9,17-trioxoandrosta-1(10),2-diene-4-oate hydrolase
MLHGGGGLHINHAHALLAEQHRVIALELPGFGTSVLGAQTQSLRDLAGTVLRVADALGIDQFSLVGTSFGSVVSGWTAADALERIDKLVLVSPAAIRPHDWRLPTPSSPQEVKESFFAHPDQHELPSVDPAIGKRQAELLARFLARPDEELERRLRHLDVPTLAVFGTEDRITPSALGRSYVELIPTCYLALVYDAGHALEIERPEALAEIVTDFLARGPQFVVSTTSTLIFP